MMSSSVPDVSLAQRLEIEAQYNVVKYARIPMPLNLYLPFLSGPLYEPSIMMFLAVPVMVSPLI